MQTERWKNIKRILDATLDMPTADRSKHIEGLKIDDETRREIISLLDVEQQSAKFMSMPANYFALDFFSDHETEIQSQTGQTIGIYQIERELGLGGMGAVYQAKRTDGKFDQTVALKLLKRELNTSSLRRRFQHEREILGSLEHPNIARLLDAGTTEDKIPYLVMEYVEGLPIDTYCSKYALGLSARLDLFRQVCSAVDFAHRNLIVHRDLKPSNILVTNDGTPKLLDFGISKILSSELEQSDTATITKLGVMTPSYASPEQIQGKSVTTATDIYSLGIILYELLSGHRPFEKKESDLKEIYRAVIETDPPLPSSIAATGPKATNDDDEAATEILSDIKSNIAPVKTDASPIRHTRPQNIDLNPYSLRGDLDNIVLKALRKEPERRYSSPENLADDLKRHLQGLPVTARPNTFSYRAEKFIKRNKAAVFAGTLILLAIASGIIATLWQARIAQAQRVKAERRFNDVRSLANSFLFNLAPKIEKLPGSTAAREELVNLALQYLDSLSKEASDDLELQRELAKAYEKVGDVQGNPSSPNIGDFKGATKSYEKAQSIRRKLIEKEPNNLAEQGSLANNLLITGNINLNGGDSIIAEESYNEGVEISNKILEKDPKNFDVRNNLANLFFRQGQIQFHKTKYDKAQEYYNRSLELYKTLSEENPADYKTKQNVASTNVYIGEAIGWAGDVKTAAEKIQQSIDVLASLAKEHPNDNILRRELMLAYLKKGEELNDITEKKQEALESFNKSLAIANQTLEQDPHNFQAKRDKVLIYQYRSLALDEAQTIKDYNSSISILNDLKVEDPNNKMITYDLGTTYFYLAQTYSKVKDYNAMVSAYQRATEKGQEYLSKDPAQSASKRLVAVSLYGLGNGYRNLAKQDNKNETWKKSRDAYRESLERLEQIKTDGNLSAQDEPKFGEIEKYLAEIETKLNSVTRN